MCRPWDWSRDWHCLGDASDVFGAIWGVDPMALVRGRALSIRGALGVVSGFGGMDAMAAECFASAGLVRGPAVPGAIAVGPSAVAAFGGRAAMICIEPGLWAGKGRDGMAMIEADCEGWSCRS
jgi:hypothetical protein